MNRNVLKLFLPILALLALVFVPSATAKPGGGNEGVDTLPAFAAVELDNGFDAVTFDGSSWAVIDSALVDDLIDDASVTSLVEDGETTLLTVGSTGSALEASVLAALASAPPASAPTADTHPAPSRDEYHLRKCYQSRDGTEKWLYKTLVVEKRSGETGSEFQKRSERELRDATDAGWESVP